MKPITLLILLCTLLSPDLLSGQVRERMHRHGARAATFSLPLRFAGPTVLGSDAQAFRYPAKNRKPLPSMEISLVTLPPTLVADLDGTPESIAQYVATTYHGAGTSSSPPRSETVGSRSADLREFTLTIPSPGRLELWLVPNDVGGFVALGLRTFSSEVPSEYTAIRAALLSTFTPRP